MALTISESGGGTFEQAPKGNHNATCYRLVDVGTHSETFEGETKQRHSIFIYWELNDAKMEDGRPYTIFKQYTLSLYEKSALYKDLCAWRKKQFTDEERKGFDLTNILGMTCELAIGETKTGNSKVVNVFAPDGGAQKQPTVNEQVAFDIDEYIAGDKDMIGVWVDLPSWIQTKIDDSFEAKAKDTAREQGNSNQFDSLESLNESQEDKPFPSDDDQEEMDKLPF